MAEAKPFSISKQLVVKAFQLVKANRAAQRVRETVLGWRVVTWSTRSLADVARQMNPVVRGWIAYYGQYYRSRCLSVLGRCLTFAFVKWAIWKYKHLRGRWWRAYHWLGRVAAREPELFVHWRLGMRPTAG